jgi:hypothetical protein
MARKPKQTDENTNSTVEARRATEAERQAAANAERAQIMADTKAAQAATAKRLDTKPTDSRTIA